MQFPVPFTVAGITPPSGLPVAFKTGETEGLMSRRSLTAELLFLEASRFLQTSE